MKVFLINRMLYNYDIYQLFKWIFVFYKFIDNKKVLMSIQKFKLNTIEQRTK